MDRRTDAGEGRWPGEAGRPALVGSTWLGRTLLLYRVDVAEAPAVRELIPAASPGAWVEIVVED